MSREQIEIGEQLNNMLDKSFLDKAKDPLANLRKKLEGLPDQSEGDIPVHTNRTDTTYKAIFPVLNEMKVITIFEKAITEKFKDTLTPADFEKTTEILLNKLVEIENYIVSHHALVGSPISSDRDHWTRNKMRSQWAESVANSWLKHDIQGVDNLKSRVPAIISLSHKMALSTPEYSKEPYLVNDRTQIRLNIDKAVSKAIELKVLANADVDSISLITEDIINHAEQYLKHVTDDVLQEDNNAPFLMAMSLSKVINYYESEFVRAYRNNEGNVDALRSVANDKVTNTLKVLSDVSKTRLPETPIEHTESKIARFP